MDTIDADADVVPLLAVELVAVPVSAMLPLVIMVLPSDMPDMPDMPDMDSPDDMGMTLMVMVDIWAAATLARRAMMEVVNCMVSVVGDWLV